MGIPKVRTQCLIVLSVLSDNCVFRPESHYSLNSYYTMGNMTWNDTEDEEDEDEDQDDQDD